MCLVSADKKNMNGKTSERITKMLKRNIEFSEFHSRGIEGKQKEEKKVMEKERAREGGQCGKMIFVNRVWKSKGRRREGEKGEASE